jgi:ParB/RepB/Spo0J family partition protein
MANFAFIPPDKITPHPKNVRRSAVADDEMLDSIRVGGIVTALTVAPAPDGDSYTLIAGHRRLDGARTLGLSTVPAMIRNDLVTEQQQLEAMLIENGRRTDLSPMEEADAYAQLELFGCKPEDIAHVTGCAVSTVKARLQLVRLPESTRDKIHDRQLTLDDAAALLEFADDPETLSRLEDLGGSGANLRYHVERERSARQRAAAHAEIIAGFGGRGIKPVEKVQGRWPWHAGDGAHGDVVPLSWLPDDADIPDEDLAYAHGGYSDPFLVCTRASAYRPQADPGASAERAEQEAEAERRRAEDAQRRADERSALRLRVDHAMGAVGAPRLPKPLLALVGLAITEVIRYGEGFHGDALLHALGHDLDIDPGGVYVPWATRVAPVLADLTTDTKRTRALSAYLVAVMEGQLAEVQHSDEVDEVLEGLAVFDWLTATGYQATPVDVAMREQLQSRLADLDTEAVAS